MNQLLKEIYATKFTADREGNLVNPFPTSIPFETGVILYDFIRNEGLKKTIEIGMAYGLSTLFMCQAHKDKGEGSHTAIDPMQSSQWRSIGLLNLEKASLREILQFYQAPSFEVLPQLLIRGESFDLAFIDGKHLFDYTLVDFFYIDLMLKTGGFVVFDDLWMPAKEKLVSYVAANRSYMFVDPVSNASPSKLKQAARVVRHMLRDPLLRGVPLRVIKRKVCILKKLAADNRQWNFHRPF